MVSGQEKEKNGEKGETVRDRMINTGINKKKNKKKKTHTKRKTRYGESKKKKNPQGERRIYKYRDKERQQDSRADKRGTIKWHQPVNLLDLFQGYQGTNFHLVFCYLYYSSKGIGSRAGTEVETKVRGLISKSLGRNVMKNYDMAVFYYLYLSICFSSNIASDSASVRKLFSQEMKKGKTHFSLVNEIDMLS